MELDDNVFYTPSEFAKLRNCSIPTALSIYNLKHLLVLLQIIRIDSDIKWQKHYFAKQEYVLDKNRRVNNQICNGDYFGCLISEMQEILSNQHFFYQKITSITPEGIIVKSDIFITKSIIYERNT